MRPALPPLIPALALLLSASLPTCARAQQASPQVLLQGSQGEILVTVELARTGEEMARGLMFRQQLADDAGMLFIYPADGVHSFWMKNTYLPLDMIFIGTDRRVVGVVENAEPLTLSSRSVGKPSRYVLEVNAGFARRHGVGPGTAVQFWGIPDLAVPAR